MINVEMLLFGLFYTQVSCEFIVKKEKDCHHFPSSPNDLR